MSDDISLVPAVANETMMEEGVKSLSRAMEDGISFSDYTQIVSNVWEDMHSAYTGQGKVED